MHSHWPRSELCWSADYRACKIVEFELLVLRLIELTSWNLPSFIHFEFEYCDCFWILFSHLSGLSGTFSFLFYFQGIFHSLFRVPCIVVIALVFGECHFELLHCPEVLKIVDWISIALLHIWCFEIQVEFLLHILWSCSCVIAYLMIWTFLWTWN